MESTAYAISPTPSINRIQEIFRVRRDAPDIGPLRLNNGEQDQRKLNKLCKDVANGLIRTDEILLTTGIGLSAKNDALPVRLPSLLLPALQMMRRIRQTGMPVPQYLVYQATDFIAEQNGIPSDKATGRAMRMKEYLQNFLAEHYPDLIDRVLLEFNLPFDESVRESVAEIRGKILEAVKNIPEIADAMEQLRTAEQAHSKKSGTAPDYAAANVLYNGACYPDYPFPLDPKAILVIGGRAEQAFFTLTSHFADLHDRIPVIPLMTHIGSRPVYYPNEEKGDPVSPREFETASRNQLLDGPIRHDLAALRAAGVNPESLQRIFPTF